MKKTENLLFAGRCWKVKESGGQQVGPGPNYFSTDGVWVDPQGYLHLTIKQVNFHFQCSQVILQQKTGYGLYTVVTSANVDKINPHAVLGIFTYESDIKEIDIEWSRWGKNTQNNCQFVVQPLSSKSLFRSHVDLNGSDAICKFWWKENQVQFEVGRKVNEQGYETLSKWRASRPQVNIPDPNNPRFRLNLWLGGHPIKDKEVEVVIKSFSFESK